jgi:hypothetical protein
MRPGSSEATGGLRNAPDRLIGMSRPNLYGGTTLCCSPVDQPQNKFLRYRDLGHLEYDVAAMAHDPGADLAIHFNDDAFLSRRHAARISLD